MGLLIWLAVGLVIGALVGLTSRRRDAEATALTLSAGVIGACAGGLLAVLTRWGRIDELRPDALLLALLGAALFATGARVARRLRG